MKLAAVAVGLGAAGTIGVAFGLAAGNDGGAITACVQKDGTPHLVAAGTACKDNESTVTWAIQGPQGPAGPQGAKGDQGPPGVSGQTLTIIGNVAIQGRNGPILGGDGSQQAIPVISYTEGIVSPRDAASGLPTGKRQHKPFTIVKEVDSSTPLLMRACATNEILPAVQFVYHPPTASADQLKVTLQNAACASISDDTSDAGVELETISFTFQKITVEHLIGKTMFVDDWQVAAP